MNWRPALQAVTLTVTISLLTACSLAPTQPQVPAANSWQDRHSHLLALRHWVIRGKIGFRDQQRSSSALINLWTQSGDDYEIHLSAAMLGIGATRITGNDQLIRIESGSHPPHISNDPETLILDNTGWRIPIASLKYWIRGIPAPGPIDNLLLDDAYQATTLEQHGWQINYRDYETFSDYRLPTRLTLTRGGDRLVVIVKSWVPDRSNPS